ncbi:MAG: YbaB/EbfC family nucleoid-associated protein [Alphaproteobacteria bacterium]|nr:YbaB/EbfC family nucleoid-associated protein [Alphaproteobacteria bacterium]
MKNIGNMMRQAQEVQTRMATMQTELASLELQGASGGGLVSVMMSGNGECKKITLDPKVVDPTDIGMLEDLIVAAYNDAHKKIQQHVQSETQKIMGGMALPPGFKLPF